ncbi:glycoside hydrolase family 18 protein [Solitalea koreensis]|uniref:chitinase n=1 Tax=Solitalea koreensis TaxID=543615 RepID=A0A521AZT1_9SPHI|nr:glycoside hydrolase family 18 protein [Solitalea koreensis]SMO40316.1 Glycosyl hydrolases family 18 [Solitalea koreensis]
MKHLQLIIMCLSMLLGCKKSENVEAQSREKTPITETKIMIAGYLPSYGFNGYDFQNLNYVNRVYYFSIEPDVVGGFQMTDVDSTNIEFLKTKLSSQQELFVTIGGWVKSQNIPTMAADPVKRSAYISKLLGYCQRRNIKGIDLDWEDYPNTVSQSSYVTLVKELAEALRPKGIKFSVALGDTKSAFGQQVNNYVDQINLMTYGKLDANGNQSTMLQLTNALSSFVGTGIPKNKLLAGVPFYGKRSADPVSMKYSEIVSASSPATTLNKYDSYSFNGRSFLQDKTAFLRQNGYGGIMVWELSQDVSSTSPYSLLKCIYERNY